MTENNITGTTNDDVVEPETKNIAPPSPSRYQVYLFSVSLIGILLITYGIILLPSFEAENLTTFLLLILLAAVTQFVSVLASSGINFSVSSAVSMSAIPLFGPFGATVVAGAAELSLWAITIRSNRPPWNRAIQRLAFNLGMNAISIFVAGQVFLKIASWLPEQSTWQFVLPWLPTAVVADQINLWILIGILYLQQNAKPLDVWRDHVWAVPLNIIIPGVGGAVLAYAILQFNLAGIVIFFLPILLSSYSFAAYVTKTKAQMVKLEELVLERTSDLEFANRELSLLNDELSSLVTEKDAFLSVLTHDMRTPLTSIKGYASILRDREMEREQQVKIASIVIRAQEALLDIVNNILDIEKFQSGLPDLYEFAPFDLAAVLRQACELVQVQAAERQITLDYQGVPVEPVIIIGDRAKIERTCMNLLSNGVKYTPNNVDGFVTVALTVNGRFCTVEVADTGYGIPADELPYIFDRYSRVKGHRTLAVGTGLGLAIVKSIVEAHKGEITVTSEVDKGSTFSVKLPIPVSD